MLNFIKNIFKPLLPTFDDHIERLPKRIWDGVHNMTSAECCLKGINPHGGKGMTMEPNWDTSLKSKHAKQYISKSIEALNEAMYLAEEAIKLAQGDHSLLEKLIRVVEDPNFTKQLSISPNLDDIADGNVGFHFDDPQITDNWVQGFCITWINQFNELLPEDYTKRAKVQLLE